MKFLELMENRDDYLYELNKWLIDNPEVFVQQVLPKELLEEIWYFQHITINKYKNEESE
jgi:hypothetical protein